MKKIIFLIALFLGMMIQANAVIITKTASNNNPHVGEVFEYTIKISGITSLADLGQVQDALDPNLDFISSDFNSSSGVFAFYSFWCPTAISGLIQPLPYAPGTLIFQFPGGSACSGSGSGDLSFKIKVALKAGACTLGNGFTITNQVKLLNQSSIIIATSAIDSESSTQVNLNNPWTLNKTFKSFTGGYLIYDVRFASTVGEYNMNVLPAVSFLDSFTTSPCIAASIAGSEVVYVPNESSPGSAISIASAIATVPGMSFNWNLPTSPSGNTLSSYLFQVKIKTTGCTCGPTAFDLLNFAKAHLTDVCGVDTTLTDNFDLLNAVCSPDGGIVIPEEAKVCASKIVKLDDNNINLTMAGCKGKYIITLKNCTNTYNYDIIKLVDNFPSSSLITVNTSGITVSPALYTPALTPAPTTAVLNFYSTIPLAPGGIITITIPFTVTTPLPNQFIQNCASFKVNLNNGVAPPTTITGSFCDDGIRTVPNEATIITNKKLCTTSLHSCGGFTTNNFLPGDDVEYALHVYNYGTTDATNVTIVDNLPTYFATNLSNIKIYKVSHYGNQIANTCDIDTITSISDITTSAAVTLTGNKFTIALGSSNILDKFTCSGITHYIVKVKATIAITAPNGSYTNVFQTKFKDAGSGLTHSQISNAVTLIVNKDQLVFTKKTANKVSQDCVKKTATVDYEIWAVNMGYLPITLMIKDVITVPSPISIISGISSFGNLQYAECNPACGSWNPLLPSGSMTVSSTLNTLTINQYQLNPCTLVKIKYSVVYNTNNLNVGQIHNVCNNAVVTVGYMSKYIIDHKWDKLPPILVYKDAELINQYFDATSGSEKLLIAEKMKKERRYEDRAKLIKWTPGGPIGLPTVFIPIDTINNPACVPITDCLNGSTRGCFTSGTGNFTFNITGINSAGQVNTTLIIPPAGPRIRKIEYVLSDIRMVGSGGFCMFCCSQTTLGNFTPINPTVFTTLPYTGILGPSGGFFKELNKVEFSNPAFSTLSGTYSPNFQLPVSLNCNGNIEIVVTCIIYFEDCSICYQSKAYDYHAVHSWTWPDYSTSTGTIIDKTKIKTVFSPNDNPVPAKADIHRSRSNIKQQ